MSGGKPTADRRTGGKFELLITPDGIGRMVDAMYAYDLLRWQSPEADRQLALALLMVVSGEYGGMDEILELLHKHQIPICDLT